MRNLFTLTLAAFAAAPAFGAVILYSDFGPPGNPYTGSGWVVNNQQGVAVGFSVNSSAPLLEIDLPLFWQSPDPSILPNQPLLVELVGPYPSGQQTPGIPGTVIESWQITATGPPVTTNVYHLSSLLQPVLDPQQKYFLQLSTPGLSEIFRWGWNLNSQGVNGVEFKNSPTWAFSPNQPSPTLEVLGGASTQSPTPEPTSAGLIGVGLFAGVMVRRRMARC